MTWKSASVEDLFVDRTGGNKKLQQSEFLGSGVLPIVDQGQRFIAGYTNDEDARCNVTLPCVIFGDHTRLFKFIDFPFALGADGVKVLEPSTEIDARYGYYYLNQVKLAGKGGYQRNFKYLKEVSIPLPPLPIQKQIAAILEKADAAREKRRQANQLTEQFLQSAFLEMFGDPVTNPRGWKSAKLGDILERIESGKSPVCLERIALPNEWGVLKLGAVTPGRYDDRKNKALPENVKPEQEDEIHPGDVLLVRKNTYELVGRTALVFKTRPKLLLSDLTFRLVFKKEIVTGHYLWQALSHEANQRKIHNLSGGSAGSMPNVSKERLKSLSLPVPPLTQQQKFVALVEKVEGLRAKQQESEKELENLFQSLMQRAFRGELVQ